MVQQLLIGIEVDRLLRYRVGTAERLARRGKFPHVVLPNGEIRFKEAEIEALLTSSTPQEVAST
jgi:predicted site-specific integrase-resolvase